MAADESPSPPSVAPSVNFIRGRLRALTRVQLALVLLAYILLCHVVGLYHFTQGFLLTRLTLENVTPANSAPLAGSHSKAIVLIIDALRTDFVVPWPNDSFFNNVLTLPGRLAAEDPSRSLIFDAHSDPPTTTMQRIKGITTGSLPTFIDAGANFASTAILEDSWISQATAAGKRVAFMGDDTWMRLFPDSFASAHPYDSFNVEDLHTVDEGVIEHLFPHMRNATWDVIIGHFLGVDHVGHRTGPYTSTMRDKLQQMNDVLERVVAEMDDDTLLLVLGDHGMDDRGDHGGDGLKETSSALWMYSKTPFVQRTGGITRLVLGGGPEVRTLDQIDLVPTLSLMLGLPIPYNNLGSVIPECFSDADLPRAIEANRKQVETYIRSYNKLSPNPRLAKLLQDGGGTPSRALHVLRSLWAQFSFPEMSVGLVILGLSAVMIWAYYTLIRNTRHQWYAAVAESLAISLQVGGLAGSLVGSLRGFYTRTPAEAISWSLAAGVVAAEVMSIVPLLPAIRATVRRNLGSASSLAAPLATVLHALAFGANSFLIWEDRLTTFLLITLALLPIVKALVAPMPRLRLRIFAFSLGLAAVCRLIALSTVCREEQQPYCRVTFYAGTSSASSPTWILYAVIPLAWNLPRILVFFLAPSRSNSGPAIPFLHAFRIILTLASCYWILEMADGWDGIEARAMPYLKAGRVWLARSIMGFTLGAGLLFWRNMPLCIDIKREDQTGASKEVTVLGFANSYGSGYLLFFAIPFTIVYLVNQPSGQAVLLLVFVALLLHLEALDAGRDSLNMLTAFASSGNPEEAAMTTRTQSPTYREILVLVLLGQAAFFATGHQAVFTTLQWKSAFVGTSTVVYPLSPVLVALNAWGGPILLALSVPLITLWNVSPIPNGGVPLVADTLQAALGFILHLTSITFTSALCSAWLRRHLMVWKVFAPRFMSAGVTLLVVEVALLVAVGFGLSGMSGKVRRTFKCEVL